MLITVVGTDFPGALGVLVKGDDIVTDFSKARVRAILDIYSLQGRSREQQAADIAEHAIDLALSRRRRDAYLARNALRNARFSVLRSIRSDVQRVEPRSGDDPDASIEMLMSDDGVSKAARPISVERALIMRDALDTLLNQVKAELGPLGVEVARRYLDTIEHVAGELGISEDRVKTLRADIRAIAERMSDEVRP